VESYDEPEAYGPYSDEQQAKDVQLLLQLELDGDYDISVLPLQQYEAKNLT